MPIWKYRIDSLKGSAMPAPEERIWRFPVQGHPIGRAAMDEKNYYTCFLHAPEKPGGRYKIRPLVLDRGASGL